MTTNRTTKTDDILTIQDGDTYRITADPVIPFCVCVPHRTRAYIRRPEDWPPIEEDGDRYVEGDHDLSGCHLVESLDDALHLLDASDSRGGQARHQAIRVAVITLRELLDQNVIEECHDNDN